jgi:hypothetical protein
LFARAARALPSPAIYPHHAVEHGDEGGQGVRGRDDAHGEAAFEVGRRRLQLAVEARFHLLEAPVHLFAQLGEAPVHLIEAPVDLLLGRQARLGGGKEFEERSSTVPSA